MKDMVMQVIVIGATKAEVETIIWVIIGISILVLIALFIIGIRTGGFGILFSLNDTLKSFT